MDGDTLIVVAAGAAVAGLVQGLSGFAFGLVATAIWSHFLPPQATAPMVVACSLVGQAISIRRVLPMLDLRLAAPMVAGGVVGIPVGIGLLRVVDPVAFKAAVGAVLAAYCPAMLFASRLPRVRGIGRWADAAVGLVGGVMGGLGGLNGPAPTLWCALRGWPRDVQRAAFQTFIVVGHVLTLAGYLATGTFGRDAAFLSAVAIPAMVVPALLGARLYHRISDAGFRRTVLVLLFVTGLALLADAVPVLLARGTAAP